MRTFTLKNALVGFGLLASTGIVAAQVFELEQVQIQEGVTEVTLNWTFEYEFDGQGTPLSGVGFDITYDGTLVTDVDLTDCLDDVPAQLTNCADIPAPNTFRLNWGNLDASIPIEDSSGSMTFTIAAGAEEGDSAVIEVVQVAAATSPIDATSDIIEGSVTVIGSDANLVITSPSLPFDFGSIDLDDAPICQDFVLQNVGDNDSLTVGQASAPAPFGIGADGCDGETLAPGANCTVGVCFNPTAVGSFSEDVTFPSDANDLSTTVSGQATAESDIVINPPFGPVNLGFGESGDILTANGTVVNNGSLAADVSCEFTSNDSDVFSIDPDISGGVSIPPTGEPVGFELSCALPEDAEEGTQFFGTLECSIDGDFAGQHDLECGVRAFDPLPVPTMQAWALGLFALLMLLVGGISIRFFRAA